MYLTKCSIASKDGISKCEEVVNIPIVVIKQSIIRGRLAAN